MQEFADALREFNPGHGAIDQAEAATRDLEDTRQQLDNQRKEQEDKILQDQQGALLQRALLEHEWYQLM